jgi:hypothetical protein
MVFALAFRRAFPRSDSAAAISKPEVVCAELIQVIYKPVGAVARLVRPTDLAMLALPSLTILAAVLLAALPALIRAVRIDPAAMLRAE